jgi:hypothetical protein
MKRAGLFVMVLAGFVAGVAFVYSCGGGASSAVAGGDADTLGGYPPGYFAAAAELQSAMPGSYPVTPLDFSNTLVEFGPVPVLAGGLYTGSIFSPVALPFKCVINSIQMLAMDNDGSEEITATLYQGGSDLFTISTGPVYASANTQHFVSLSSPPATDVNYDPSSGDPLYMEVDFSAITNNLQVFWLKVNYSIPVP